MNDNQLIKLYDGRGNTISEFHPRFNDVQRELRFGYNDDSSRRGKPKPLSQSGAETWMRNRDRMKAMADARDAAEYDWIGGMLARVVLYVCGRLHIKSNSGDGRVDAAYDDYMHGWSGDERNDDGTTRCDLTGRHRFLKLIQMSFLAHLTDGDHGFIEIDPQFSPTGEFCLQSIRADRIGSPLDARQDENYIGGISIDPDTGRVASYRIFRRTRTGQYIDPQDIEPSAFIHVFDPDLDDEYRGRTKLLRCLNDLRDIRETLTSEMISAKTQSQFSVLVGQKDPFNGNGPGAWDGKTAAGTPSQDAQWGKILRMAEGENFNMLAPAARPSGAFMSLVQMLIRKMAISLGLSYGLMWDLASLGGANTRVELQADLRKIQYWQDNVLEGLIVKRVRNKVIAQGIARQELPPSPRWKACTLNWGPHITADIGYEMESDIASITHGIGEIEAVTAKHTGKSFREICESNADAANIALEVGASRQLPAEAFAAGQFPQLTNQKAAFLTPTPQPPPPPLSIQAIGDKGIKPLIEVMEKVGNGTIDRESAIEAVMRIYSIKRSEAELIIPDEPEEEQLNRNAGLTPEGKHAPVVAGPKTASSNGSKNGKKAAVSRN